MNVLDLGHAEVVALLAVDHDWEAGVVGVAGVVVFIGLLDVDGLLFIVHLAEGGEVAVRLVDGVRFGGDWGVGVPLQLLQVGHICTSYRKYYKTNRKAVSQR